MKKNGDANNNPVLIIVLAIIFTLGGIGCIVSLILSGFNGVLLAIGLIMLVVGILFLIFGISRNRKLKGYKALLNDPTAYITEAHFERAKFSSYSSKSVGVGGINVPTSVNVYKKVIYTYTDENGLTQTGTSTLSYTPNQVDYLQNKGVFRIKCKGAVSVIIEELPPQNAHYNV